MNNTSMFLLRKCAGLIAFAAAIGGLATSAAAEGTYPVDVIRIVVPFSPGGGTDMVSRTLGAEITRELGQPVIIENKPGAGTIIGSDFVARSKPDGYMLLMATFAHAVNPSMVSNLPYATDKAFTPIALIGRSPNVLVVKSDSPYKSVRNIVAAAKANPGKLTFASQGNGTSAHMAGELLENLARIELTHVPYKGAGPALSDVLGGQVDMMFGTAAAVTPLLQSGKLRAIAVTTAERSPAFSSVPTMAESGIAGYAAESWYGLFAPAGTPSEVISKINSVVKKALMADAFKKPAQNEGLILNGGSPAALGAYVQGEQERWAKVVKEKNMVTAVRIVR